MKLSFAAFVSPIPVPGTHWRLSEFTTSPGPHPEHGWDIEDDEGRIWLRKGELEFYTYVEASCAPMLRATSMEPPVMAEHPSQVEFRNSMAEGYLAARADAVNAINAANAEATPKRRKR